MKNENNDSQPHPDQHFGNRFYSQNGEDIMLLNIFKQLEIEKPSYLDIGCHHPINISNTYMLYERGSRGICVDANPNLREFWKEFRPEDQFVNIGVGPVAGVQTFYMYDDLSGRNTFSTAEVRSMEGIMPSSPQPSPVTIVTLNSVVDACLEGVFPDLLCLDIEGLDLDVLAQADFAESAPKVILVEANDSVEPFYSLFFKKKFTVYVHMGKNIIAVHQDYNKTLRRREI